MALLHVIKFDGPAHMLVWKFPKENMNIGSQLVVGPSQEAVFITGGQICDVMGPGTYTLNTMNIPILSALVNLPFGGKSPFTAEIFFVNKLNILDMKWGTPLPIPFKDPVYQVAVPLRAFGQYGVAVQDSCLFLEKLTGAVHAYTADDLTAYFRGVVGNRITDELTNHLIRERLSFLDASAHITQISQAIAQRLETFFAQYGVRLVNFCINSINVPENDPSVQMLKAVLSKRHEMDALNFNYQQAKAFDVLGRAAENLGGDGGLSGIGVGAAMGSVMSELVRNTLQGDAAPQSPAFCRYCGSALPAGSGFCPKCGQAVNVPPLCCKHCGTPHQLGDRFCTRCGQPLACEPDPIA